MFVDASALVTVLAREPGHETLAQRLDEAAVPLISGIAILEAVLAVRRLNGRTIAEAEVLIRDLLDTIRAQEIAITPSVTRIAIATYARYGKGQGHPAQLNMGDCFAYACARTHDVPLLYVGDDFSQTDIRSAIA